MDSPARKGENMKERFNRISSMRSFEESPSKWFLFGATKVRRSALEKQSYFLLKKLILQGKIKSIQRIG